VCPRPCAAARIDTAGKDAAHPAAGIVARNELAAIITKSRQLGSMGIELDARLAPAEIEMNTGQITAGRTPLTAIEADARAKGYNLVARQAAVAREVGASKSSQSHTHLLRRRVVSCKPHRRRDSVAPRFLVG
jgi:hypothetical protein